MDDSAKLVSPFDGRTVWTAKYPIHDPNASTGRLQAIRFGQTLIVSQQRQGRDYFVSLTGLDVRTGKSKWHRLYKTSTFDSKKVEDRLYTRVGTCWREVSVFDGSLGAASNLPRKTEPPYPHSFPEGRPVVSFPWKRGWLATYDYEDAEMYSGEMAGVRGLAYVTLERGQWVDAWSKRWMTQLKGRTRNPGPQYARLLATDDLAWVVIDSETGQSLAGIDQSGSIKRKVRISPEIRPKQTSRGIVFASEGWICILKKGKIQRLRQLLQTDPHASLCPFGMLEFGPLSSDDPKTRPWHIALTPVFQAARN